MIKFKNLPEDDRCVKCDHECNEDCGNVEPKSALCELLGVELDEKFNIVGQYYTNPYTIRCDSGVVTIFDSNDEYIDLNVLFKVIQDPTNYITKYHSLKLRRAFNALITLGYVYVVRNPSRYRIECTVLFSNKPPFRASTQSDWVTKGNFISVTDTNIDPFLFDFIKGDNPLPFVIPEIAHEE